MEEQLKSGKWDGDTTVENFNEDISKTSISETCWDSWFLKDEETCADGGDLLYVTENFNHVN